MTQRKGPGWVPLQKATVAPLNPKMLARARADPAYAAALNDEIREREMWKNDKYTVTVYRHDDGVIRLLSIKRNDGGAVRDWRHMQKIKNELAGRETEAIQLFPAESRLVDTANQTWLWCFPPGTQLPLGFPDRAVGGPEEAAEVGAHQREFEPGIIDEEKAS